MADYIDRNLLAECVDSHNNVHWEDIANTPSADVQPVVHGEWIEKETFHDENADVISDWQSARCSVCNTYHTTPYSYYFTDYNFCPNCGSYNGGKNGT